ncbi:uncharacterized protein LOC125004300 [Mugil cephalus]|uniref:uncharacterized protein LOC125004300 n=1 Tax=Mugil cephalus TaxID=48193 RepID=UPI001FB5BA7C|nr:uncharacterized protein LOC125004300 [Mugil cephalus]
MKCVVAAAAAVVLLSLVSLGRSAPLLGCDSIVKPITVSKEETLGEWLYVGSSSNVPGSRSLGHLLTSVWFNITENSESNILDVLQVQRTYGECSAMKYNVIFEDSAMIIEQPFYLKDVFLTTDCADCLVIFEEVVSGQNEFTSLLLFSRGKTASPDTLELFKKQAECLRMPSPIILDPNYDMCPADIQPVEGLSALNSLLQTKMLRFARILDFFFDMFVN